MSFKQTIKADVDELLRMTNKKNMIEGANLLYGYMMGLKTGLSEDGDDLQKESDVLSSDT